MIQPKTESGDVKSRIESIKAETGQQNVRLRDPRLARQMQFQNSAQRNFAHRNRNASVTGIQRFGPSSVAFNANSQQDNSVVNRPTAAFKATNMDDSGRQSRTANKNRSSSKDVKSRLISKTSPKSQKSNSQKSSKPSSTASSLKSPSKSSKTSPSSRSSSKDLKKDRYKEKESNKLSPTRSSAIVVASAEAEKKMKEYTIPFKKRSPSPKSKSPKSITDPKVSSTTKTADSPTKFKGGKTNAKPRNYVRRNRDESKSPIPNKENTEIVQLKSSPPNTTASSTTATTGSPIPPAVVEPVQNVSADISSVPFAGVGENQNFKSKKHTTFVVRMVKISHIVHSLLTSPMIGLIFDCINRRDDILNKLIVIGTGDNFFIKTFCRFFFQFNFFILTIILD